MKLRVVRPGGIFYFFSVGKLMPLYNVSVTIQRIVACLILYIHTLDPYFDLKITQQRKITSSLLYKMFIAVDS